MRKIILMMWVGTGPMVEFARIWRDMPKIVFSRTLERADWNTTVVRNVVADQVMELKAQPGGDLVLGLRRLSISRFVDNQTPKASLRPRGPEMFEVEREDRQPVSLGVSHYRRVAYAQAQICIARIDFHRSTEERWGEEHDGMFAVGRRLEKEMS